jgi:hypothetical protein
MYKIKSPTRHKAYLGDFFVFFLSPDSILQSLVKLEYIDKLIILESGLKF